MNEKKAPLTRRKSLPDMSEKEVLGAEAPACQIQQAVGGVEHGGTICLTIPVNLPKELAGIKATEHGNGLFSVRRIQKWIESIPGDVVCVYQDYWKELAGFINSMDGRLAEMMLKKLKASMKQEVGFVSEESPEENKDNTSKRPLDEDDNIDYTQISVAEQALLENEYSSDYILDARAALLAKGIDPTTASAEEYIKALENDQETQTTLTQEKQSSTSKKKKICKDCVDTLHRCREGCGHLIRGTEAAQL